MADGASGRYAQTTWHHLASRIYGNYEEVVDANFCSHLNTMLWASGHYVNVSRITRRISSWRRNCCVCDAFQVNHSKWLHQECIISFLIGEREEEEKEEGQRFHWMDFCSTWKSIVDLPKWHVHHDLDSR